MSIKGTPQKKKKNAGPVKKAPTVISMVAHQKEVAMYKANVNELSAKMKHLDKHIKELQALLTETEAGKDTLQYAIQAANNEIVNLKLDIKDLSEKKDNQIGQLIAQKEALALGRGDLEAQIKRLAGFISMNIGNDLLNTDDPVNRIIREYTELTIKYKRCLYQHNTAGSNIAGAGSMSVKAQASNMLQTLAAMKQKDQLYVLQQLCGNIHRQALERVAKLKNDSGYAEMTLNNIEQLFDSVSSGTLYSDPESEAL